MSSNNRMNFWKNLFVFLIVIGTIYGFTIYFALQERKQKEEWRKSDEERRSRIEKARKLNETHRDSIILSIKKRPRKNDIGEMQYKDDDIDPYDNPDFDDLIPGEEYDEEFVDRDTGDPELYN